MIIWKRNSHWHRPGEHGKSSGWIPESASWRRIFAAGPYDFKGLRDSSPGHFCRFPGYEERRRIPRRQKSRFRNWSISFPISKLSVDLFSDRKGKLSERRAYMSFLHLIKIDDIWKCTASMRKPSLTALIRMSGQFSIYNQAFVLNVQTGVSNHARRMYALLKDHYLDSLVLVVGKWNWKTTSCAPETKLKVSLSDLNIFDEHAFKTQVSEDIMNITRKGALHHLRGALAGMVNSPETSRYHLEIYWIMRTIIRTSATWWITSTWMRGRSSGATVSSRIWRKPKIADFGIDQCRDEIPGRPDYPRYA